MTSHNLRSSVILIPQRFGQLQCAHEIYDEENLNRYNAKPGGVTATQCCRHYEIYLERVE